MDLDALIEAAKEIDRKGVLQEERSRKLHELAAKARQVETGSREHRALQDQLRLMTPTVVDFGVCIQELRRALHANPKRKRA